MAANNSTTNDASYVAGNQLADAAMLISCAMRLTDKTNIEAYCLLEKAMEEIIASQDYLERIDAVQSPIDRDVAAMIGRIAQSH